MRKQQDCSFDGAYCYDVFVGGKAGHILVDGYLFGCFGRRSVVVEQFVVGNGQNVVFLG